MSNLTFRGLTFSYSGFTLPKTGYGDAQAVVVAPRRAAPVGPAERHGVFGG